MLVLNELVSISVGIANAWDWLEARDVLRLIVKMRIMDIKSPGFFFGCLWNEVIAKISKRDFGERWLIFSVMLIEIIMPD